MKKLKFDRRKARATVVSLFLLFAMAVSLVALPAANAHTPPWRIATYVKIHVNPDHVGLA